ncbi:helix-turn-helix DNA binding domain protein [Mycobacterium phage Bobby]|nr:helix-turn-helix DNA binding domain protein [Mycobacterium phage Bobby]
MVMPHQWVMPQPHPAAELLPMMLDAEVDELAKDIQEHGLQQPIIILQDNEAETRGEPGPYPRYLLDGRNRLAALARLGVTDPERAPGGKVSTRRVHVVDLYVETSTVGRGRSGWEKALDPVTFVLSMNVKRRHLNSEQKRQAIAAYIEAKPEASAREVARELGVSHPTVSDVKRDIESSGKNYHVTQTQTDKAQAAIEADPTASQREIAEKAGVSQKTVSNARKKMVQGDSPKPKPKEKPPVNPIAAAEKDLGKLIKKYGLETLQAAMSNLLKGM